MMNDRIQEALLGFLLGALEESERSQIEARLRHDPQLREELEALRERIAPLLATRDGITPPPGLARRTCDYVFAHAAVPVRRVRRVFSSASSVGWAGRSPLADVVVTACVLLAVSLLAITAIQASRFRSHIVACQDNLHSLGTALTQFSDSHHGYFPAVPTQGKLAAAGIYAPKLTSDRLLTESRRLHCPGAASDAVELPGITELEKASDERLASLLPNLGGSYGYTLGHMRGGVYCDTKNLSRPTFAIVADLPNDALPGRRSLNHDGRGENVLFEDGHAEFRSESQVAELRDDIYRNDFGQIAPGANADDAVIVSSQTSPLANVDLH